MLLKTQSQNNNSNYFKQKSIGQGIRDWFETEFPRMIPRTTQQNWSWSKGWL